MISLIPRQRAADPRDEAALIHEVADELRTGRHWQLSDAIRAALHTETHNRYVNLCAALATDLHLTGPESQVNQYDCDWLPDGDRPDHPGSYWVRLDVWAARIGDQQAVAIALDLIADQEDGELRHPRTRVRVGGTAAERAAVVLSAPAVAGGAR